MIFHSIKDRGVSAAVGLLVLTLASTIAPADSSAIVAERDNQAAVKSSDSRLTTRLPSIKDKHPPRYLLELHATQEVRPLSSEPVQKIEVSPAPASDSSTLPAPTDDVGVLLERPSSDLLINVQKDLNPYSFDARYIEKVGLKDAIEAALAHNLDIESSYAKLRSQHYTYLSAASGFLPSLNAGYSLFGVAGSLPGSLLGGGGTSAAAGQSRLPGSIQLLNAGFTYNAYQGGAVLYGTLKEKHRTGAARAALKSSLNDTMLDAAKRHYELILNEALLSIRIRAVSISQEQVRMNAAQERAGAATGLDVLQSQAQLASDEQNLIDQQNARRHSAIQLAHVLNAGFAQDIESRETRLLKRRLIPQSIPIEELLKLAIDRRPELKEYEELRLAAKEAIVTAAAPLQPKVSLAGSVFGIGAGNSGMAPIYTLNFGVKWTLGALGATDLANIQRARWDARQSAIRAKQTFLDVFKEVRTSYDDSLASDKRIERANIQISAAQEELRIARRRMESGIGLNIDVLNAQRDLTAASINKARAVIDFNLAQAQLLRDTGTISVDGLVTGIKL